MLLFLPHSAKRGQRLVARDFLSPDKRTVRYCSFQSLSLSGFHRNQEKLWVFKLRVCPLEPPLDIENRYLDCNGSSPVLGNWLLKNQDLDHHTHQSDTCSSTLKQWDGLPIRKVLTGTGTLIGVHRKGITWTQA